MPPVGKHHGGSVARHGNIENRQALDGVTVLRRYCERRRPAPVVAHDEQFVLAENVMNQAPDILRERLLVVALHGTRRVAQTAQVRSDHAIAPGKSGDHVAPHVPGLRPAMQQDHRGPAACRHVVESHVTQVGVSMLKRFGH